MARSHIKQINLVRGSVYLRAPAPFRSFHYHGFQAHGSHPTIWRGIHRLCSSFILIRRLNEDGVAVIVVPERFLESARQISPPRASLFYSATLISPSFCSFVPSVHAGSFKSAASFRGWNIFKMELNGVDKCTWIEKKESNIKIDRSIDRDSEKHLIQNVSWLLKRTRERCTRSSNQSFSTNLVSEIHIHSYNNPGKEQAEYSNPIFRKRLKFPFAILPLSLPPSLLRSKRTERTGKSTKMRNLGKVGWAGWCPRRGRNERREGEHGSRVYARADRVCGVSQGWRVGWRMRVCGRQYGGTLPFPCPFVTRTRPSAAPPRAPTHACARGRARAHRCAGVILARARVRRAKRKIPGPGFYAARRARRAVFSCSNK